MTSLRRIGSARSSLATTLICLLALAQPACRNDEVGDSQVCAFQCDYAFDGGVDLEAAARLTKRDVVQVIANAVAEAQANGINDITVVVLDHLSNVLAVWDSDASTTDYTRITSLGAVNRTERTPFFLGPGSDFADLNFRADPSFDPNDPEFRALDTALDGIFIPNGYAAISKAGTANYFSTQGNAFTTRTANTLIQQNFVPGETDRPGGPLFAVQIAQLACSDINTRQSTDTTDLVGPRRLPVGFAADPGGLPLYKDGIPELDENGLATGRTGKVVVGAVGIEFNGVYGVDKDATDQNRNLEERIAVGATRGFEADPQRRATRITVAGRALRWVDDGGLRSRASDVPQVNVADAADRIVAQAFLNSQNPGFTGDFVFDDFFFPFEAEPVNEIPRAGVFFTTPESGVIPAIIQAPAGANFPSAEGEILVEGPTVSPLDPVAPRYVDQIVAPGPDPAVNPGVYEGRPSQFPTPPVDSLNPAPADGLSDDDVSELLVEALRLAERTRAQTRRPLGGQARVDVAVVDLDGNVLGFARSQDALLDGIDVTIAKTRAAAFWSKENAQEQILAALDPLGNNGLLNTRPFPEYIDETAAFLGEQSPPPTVDDPPFNGDVAWSSIALGGISNPNFPPGVLDAGPGPLSRENRPNAADPPAWSIFSTGLQTELVLPGIALALCEEVPDLAAVLEQLGVVASFDPYDDAERAASCPLIRDGLIGSIDPVDQTDCLIGGQDFPAGSGNITGLQNGYHIFQGAVPIYRGDTLIGAFGVSGDGAEQDDFVPFVALDEVAKAQRRRGVPNPINNAPKPIRADNIRVQNINLRYVVCPVAPFLTSNEQNGCEGR